MLLIYVENPYPNYVMNDLFLKSLCKLTLNWRALIISEKLYDEMFSYLDHKRMVRDMLAESPYFQPCLNDYIAQCLWIHSLAPSGQKTRHLMPRVWVILKILSTCFDCFNAYLFALEVLFRLSCNLQCPIYVRLNSVPPGNTFVLKTVSRL